MLTCPNCGEKHNLVPHPAKAGRVVLYCGTKGVLETWGEFSSVELNVFTDLGIETSLYLTQLGIETVGDMEDTLFSSDNSKLQAVPGIGLEGIERLKAYFLKDALKVVVTGTGRCGTRYFSKRLTSAGIRCHHELIGLAGLRGLKHRALKLGVKADSSWLAAPYLQHLPKGTTIVQLVRHPALVIKSLVSMKLLSSGDNSFTRYRKFIEKHIPDLVKRRSILDRTIRFYLDWNYMIANRVGGSLLVHHIEQDDTFLLSKLGASDFDNLFCDTTDNTRVDSNLRVKWGKANAKLMQELKTYTCQLGYNVEGEYE